MIKIGDVCPLFFNPIKDKFGIEIDYIQKFYVSDNIHLQIFAGASDDVAVRLLNLITGVFLDVSLYTYNQNSDTIMYYASLTDLPDGEYRVMVADFISEPFCVSSSLDLVERTSLIRYTHKDNNSPFDNIFWIDNKQVVFEWRVESGFKPSGYTPKLENEQYRNQMQEIVNLYSIPYDSYSLIVGDSNGVPYWYARHLNRILCLSSFKIEDIGYVRSESSVPEMSQVMEDSQLFHVSVILEPQENDIAGVGGIPETGSSSSVVGFVINNPKDGEMLQYSENEDAFVNVDYVGV
jgi:hypothetical protein